MKSPSLLKIVIFLCCLVGRANAIENAKPKLDHFSNVTFAAVLLVDKEQNIHVDEIVKGDPILAVEALERFKKIEIDLPKNTKHLYLIEEPKGLNEGGLSPSRFIPILFDNYIFIDNSLVRWRDLFGLKHPVK